VGPGGLTREVETPLPSNSPRDHVILRVDLVGSQAAEEFSSFFSSPSERRGDGTGLARIRRAVGFPMGI
jgi:hypothetical protein